MCEMYKEWEIRDHTIEEMITLGRNLRGFEVLWEKRVFGREKKSFSSKEIEKKLIWFRFRPI